MDTLDVSQKSYIMVSNLICLAMKKEISWSILSSLLDEMSSTLVKSKQVIKILLKELENLNVNLSKYKERNVRASPISARDSLP